MTSNTYLCIVSPNGIEVTSVRCEPTLVHNTALTDQEAVVDVVHTSTYAFLRIRATTAPHLSRPVYCLYVAPRCAPGESWTHTRCRHLRAKSLPKVRGALTLSCVLWGVFLENTVVQRTRTYICLRVQGRGVWTWCGSRVSRRCVCVCLVPGPWCGCVCA